MRKVTETLFGVFFYCMKEKHTFFCLVYGFHKLQICISGSFEKRFSIRLYCMCLFFFLSALKEIIKYLFSFKRRTLICVCHCINKSHCFVILSWKLNQVFYFITMLSAKTHIFAVCLFHTNFLTRWDQMLSESIQNCRIIEYLY